MHLLDDVTVERGSIMLWDLTSKVEGPLLHSRLLQSVSYRPGYGSDRDKIARKDANYGTSFRLTSNSVFAYLSPIQLNTTTYTTSWELF